MRAIVATFKGSLISSAANTSNRGVSWPDVVVVVTILAGLWLVASTGQEMLVPFSESKPLSISTDPWNIPYYALRSLLRMLIAYVFALAFTLIVGSWAAKSLSARRFLMPAIDVLQSVPVLGFLSVSITAFMALFPGSLLGVELAALFAIFTGQVWNMVLGFYNSLVTIPADLYDVARNCRMNPLQKFRKLEVPAASISLVWNSMMSFGGGWFFVVQSEAISVLNKDIRLPGLGSYIAQAVEEGNRGAALWAMASMALMLVVLHWVLWKPLIVWSQRFKLEVVESSDRSESAVLNFLRRSEWIRYLWRSFLKACTRVLDRATDKSIEVLHAGSRSFPLLSRWAGKSVRIALVAMVLWVILRGLMLLRTAELSIGWETVFEVFMLGLNTLLRVVFVVVVSSLVWTPIGVWIGSRPRVARLAQPLALIASSFPMNMLFPFVVGIFASLGWSMNYGSAFLIVLGAQWYLLFNVIAGASAMPHELREVARVFRIGGWMRWKTLVLPAIFPYWVTGACTAAGAAWNASIVAEVVSWGSATLKADGLGAYIATVSKAGDWEQIFLGITVMAMFVVAVNRLVWGRLYRLAESKFRLDG